MDSPAYLVPVVCQITQLLSTSRSVITLGHNVKQPLIRPSSELVDGYEPHDLIYSGYMTVRQLCDAGTCSVGWEGVPGVGAGWVGTRVGYTGYPAEVVI